VVGIAVRLNPASEQAGETARCARNITPVISTIAPNRSKLLEDLLRLALASQLLVVRAVPVSAVMFPHINVEKANSAAPEQRGLRRV